MLIKRLGGTERSGNERFPIESCWPANGKNTQQSAIILSVFVAALIEEGVGGMEAKARGSD